MKGHSICNLSIEKQSLCGTLEGEVLIQISEMSRLLLPQVSILFVKTDFPVGTGML